MQDTEYVYEIVDALYDSDMNYELVAEQYKLTLPELLLVAKQIPGFGTVGAC